MPRECGAWLPSFERLGTDRFRGFLALLGGQTIEVGDQRRGAAFAEHPGKVGAAGGELADRVAVVDVDDLPLPAAVAQPVVERLARLARVQRRPHQLVGTAGIDPAEDEFLSAENKALRNREGGRSLTTAAADFGKTFGLTFGWAGVYFTLLTAWLRGRTLGKFLMGTRVVRLDGRAITPMDAFVRNGGYTAGRDHGITKLLGFS